MTAVFLSHRRPDGSAYVRRLSQELAEPGGGIEIVPGLESLVPGTDIVEAIEGIVDRADVVLAVIGPDWLTDTDQHGRRRLDLATDTVRIELATALRRPEPVIPVPGRRRDHAAAGRAARRPVGAGPADADRAA